MIILENTTKSLKFNTSSSGSIDYYASYAEGSSGALSSLASNTGQVVSPTTTTLVSAPSSNYTKLVKMISLTNVGTQINTVTVYIDDNGSNIRLYEVSLRPGQSLKYSDKSDWYFITEQGFVQTQSAILNSYYNTMQQPFFATGNSTTTRTLVSQTAYAVYIGQAAKPLNQIYITWNQTTLASSLSWAEIAVAVGDVNWGGSSNLTVVGYSDISSTVGSTGVKSIQISNISPKISMGDSVWAIIAIGAGTPGAVRALSLADQLTLGFYQTAASFRPSSFLGVSSAFTANTTNGPVWIGGII